MKRRNIYLITSKTNSRNKIKNAEMFNLKLAIFLYLTVQCLIISSEVICIYVTAAFNTDLLPGKDVCGKQEENRIYGGQEAQIGEFPWMVLINSNHGFYCGGSLINNRYVLTAAHCIIDSISTVRLGEHDILTEEDCDGGEPGLEHCSDKPIDIEVEETIVHEEYDKQNKTVSDIALIRLKEEVTYSDFIKPVCLPIFPEFQNHTYEDTNVVVAGWGKTETGWASNIKLKLEVPVVPNSDCAKTYIKYRAYITNRHLCAGGVKGKSSCNGDSGGPLMYRDTVKDDDNWVCVGLVSFGLKRCALENIPAVYVKVSEYIPWIVKNMKP